MFYDVIIVGSGPAGYTAAIYAKRAGLKIVMIAGEEVGGQLMLTTSVDNFPGFVSINGPDLMQQMLQQVEKLEVEIKYGRITEINFLNNSYELIDNKAEKYLTKTVIISTGSSAKWLNIKGEKEFLGYGVSGCATCDGFFFKDQIVAVVGGGDTAVEEAIYLLNIAKKVFLIHRKDQLRASKILIDKLMSYENVEFLWNHEVTEIIGTTEPYKVLKQVALFNNKTNETSFLSLDGLFVAIGHTPNTAFLQNTKIHLTPQGYITTNKANASVLDEQGNIIGGVFAAGDVQDPVYRQAVVAAGSGCIAALEAKNFIEFISND